MANNVVNLRMARKRKERAKKEVNAEQNRISFGRTKHEKNLTKALNDKQNKLVDDQKLTPKEDD
ncbi:MAG: DUF4169 family protein [Rhizobiaceae bacterium]|nr:DUF4169 family protein [Rhizobiaceae bacterium]